MKTMLDITGNKHEILHRVSDEPCQRTVAAIADKHHQCGGFNLLIPFPLPNGLLAAFYGAVWLP